MNKQNKRYKKPMEVWGCKAARRGKRRCHDVEEKKEEGLG